MVDQFLAQQFTYFCKKHIGDSQREAAEICECSQKHVSEMQRGLTSISVETIRHLRNKKNMNIDWFFDSKGPELRKDMPKENLIVNINELRGEIEVLTGSLKHMQKLVKQVYSDFYADKHKVETVQKPSKQQ